MDKFTVLESSAFKLLYGNIAEARHIMDQEYPFLKITPQSRKCTDKEKMCQFVKDGFIDRYGGQKLINPGLLKALSCYMPEEFPYHPHWKMNACHNAYWEFVPTVDHVVPVALGGLDTEENRTTTSMLHNAVKGNWTLEQLNWTLCDPGDFKEYDGLTSLFIQLVKKDKGLLKDGYIRRWYNLSITYAQGEKH